MLICRLIIIWMILLDSFHIVFMHEIEEKLVINRNKSKRSSHLINVKPMVGSPRQSSFGGVTYLAVSLLFQLPLMEIIFVMALIILILGILLHFVELKADFFRLRRAFIREERLRQQMQRQQQLTNTSLSPQPFMHNYMQYSNTSQHLIHDQNYPYYGNAKQDSIDAQYSHNSYPSYRIPHHFLRRRLDKSFSRFPLSRPHPFRHSFINYPNFQRQPSPQRYRFPNYRLQNFERQRQSQFGGN